MTTVAYRDGVMASDSACHVGSVCVHSIQKVWKIRGHLIGCAGSLVDMHTFLKWFGAGAWEDKHPKMKDLDVLVVTPEGKVLTYEDGAPHAIEVDDEYISIGAGSPIALGALHAGATAVEAVQAAITHCSKTNGKVQVIQLGGE